MFNVNRKPYSQTTHPCHAMHIQGVQCQSQTVQVLTDTHTKGVCSHHTLYPVINAMQMHTSAVPAHPPRPAHQLHPLTAACPPSMVRYWTTSSRAFRAHSLHQTRWTRDIHIHTKYIHTYMCSGSHLMQCPQTHTYIRTQCVITHHTTPHLEVTH